MLIFHKRSLETTREEDDRWQHDTLDAKHTYIASIVPKSKIRVVDPQVESHSSTCVVRSSGEVPTLEASPLS